MAKMRVIHPQYSVLFPAIETLFRRLTILRHDGAVCFAPSFIFEMSETKSGTVIHEGWLLGVLAAIQFTAVLDFMIIMPLGPQYMRVFHIIPSQFGLIVSAYAIAAGISGIIAGFFLDRFDRKRAMMVLYAGFTLGTLFCALAPTYPTLVAARVVAGAFGGVTMGLVMAVIGDVIPEVRRGRAMGIVMSSFSVASICGVPIGLYLANQMDWHIPFYALAGLCVFVLLAIAKVMPSLRGHIDRVAQQPPAEMMAGILKEASNRRALMFMATLICTGFCVFPFLATYMVKNVGLTEQQLPWIYVCGGVCTLVSMNLIGRWADRVGKRRVFTIMMLASMIPVLIVTNLPHVAVWIALTISTIFMVCSSGRIVPAMAMLTASVEPHQRGGFMSINSSVQQLSSGVAAWLSGVIIGQSGGHMTRFGIVGGLSVIFGLAAIYLARFLKSTGAGTAVQGIVET
jgi:predicted MFS family arabinose efflux permease